MWMSVRARSQEPGFQFQAIYLYLILASKIEFVLKETLSLVRPMLVPKDNP